MSRKKGVWDDTYIDGGNAFLCGDKSDEVSMFAVQSLKGGVVSGGGGLPKSNPCKEGQKNAQIFWVLFMCVNRVV